jgi:hypothetical protein
MILLWVTLAAFAVYDPFEHQKGTIMLKLEWATQNRVDNLPEEYLF